MIFCVHYFTLFSILWNYHTKEIYAFIFSINELNYSLPNLVAFIRFISIPICIKGLCKPSKYFKELKDAIYLFYKVIKCDNFLSYLEILINNSKVNIANIVIVDSFLSYTNQSGTNGDLNCVECINSCLVQNIFGLYA